MNERLWKVSSKTYYLGDRQTVTVTGIPSHKIVWDDYDKWADINQHGMYRSCYKETALYIEYADFFFNVGDAERFAEALRQHAV